MNLTYFMKCEMFSEMHLIMANIQFIEIAEKVYYGPHPDHRNRAKHKTKWSIPRDDEIQSFRLTHSNSWFSDGNGWGLHIVNEHPDILGESYDKARELFIAKFVDGNKRFLKMFLHIFACLDCFLEKKRLKR